jgi:hypothetical protein
MGIDSEFRVKTDREDVEELFRKDFPDKWVLTAREGSEVVISLCDRYYGEGYARGNPKTIVGYGRFLQRFGAVYYGGERGSEYYSEPFDPDDFERKARAAGDWND